MSLVAATAAAGDGIIFDERCMLGTCKEARLPAPEPERPKPQGPPLTAGEISTEMRKAEAGVRTCGAAVDASGRVVATLVIAVDGRINSAIVGGRFANTPFAICVEKALKSVRFRGNDGLTLKYPFFFPPSTQVRDCGDTGGAGKRTNAAVLRRLAAPLGRCGGAGAGVGVAKIPVRLTVDADGVIRSAEAHPPYAGTREGFCVERVLGCVLGSAADGLAADWEVALNARAASPATLRPLPR
jgi:hypothetical protein